MILLTGASGFVGRHVLKEMLARQAGPIRAFLQPGETVPAGLAKSDCCHGDIRDAAIVARHVDDSISRIIHLAGIVASADEKLNHDINASGTQNLLSAAAQHNVQHFVLMSAAAVKFKTMNAYGRSKLAAEEAVRDSGLPYTIVRCPLIIGQGCQEFERFVDYVMKFPAMVPVFGSGKTIKKPIGIADVSQFMLKVLEAGPQGRTYEIACMEDISLDALIDLVLRFKNARKLKWHIPLWFSLWLAALAEKLLGGKSPVTRDILLGLNEDIQFDSAPARQELGFAPVSIEKVLMDLQGAGA